MIALVGTDQVPNREGAAEPSVNPLVRRIATQSRLVEDRDRQRPMASKLTNRGRASIAQTPTQTPPRSTRARCSSYASLVTFASTSSRRQALAVGGER
jgi:hypothetical protein